MHMFQVGGAAGWLGGTTKADVTAGMKEDLNFKGNQLNQINTVFTVGYTIGQGKYPHGVY